MKNSNRLVFILKYLLEHTDEDHYATISDINEFLRLQQLDGDRETIAACVCELKEIGYQIECIHSTQNRYYIKQRDFSLPEVKLLVDAVQSSRFIPQEKSRELVEKLAGLRGEHQSDILKRQLYVESRFKTDNLDIIETVEKVHQAIAANKKVVFQYFDYNLQKEKILKFDGWQYKLSPYVLVWNNDQYYLVGYFEKYEKITKFRLDRITNLEILEEEVIPQPNDFSIADFFEKEFSMLAGEHCKVELLCENKLMGSLIDKFGTDFQVEAVDEDHFKVSVEVALGGTFYGWVFASRGAMRITAPEEAVIGFDNLLSSYKYD